MQGQGDRSCFRGSGDLLTSFASRPPRAGDYAITFSGTGEELDAVRARAGGLTVQGPEGETYRFVPEHMLRRSPPAATPVELSHVS